MSELEPLFFHRPQYGGEIEHSRLQQLRSSAFNQQQTGEFGEKHKKYNEQQEEFKETLRQIDEGIYSEEEEHSDFIIKFAINASFGLNILLTILKLIILILSGSVSVLASFLDSCLDLMSGSIIFVASIFQKVGKHEVHLYPVGKRRLETLSVIIFAAIMFTATCQLILKSVEVILAQENLDIEIGWTTISVLLFTIVSKLVAWQLCKRISHPSVSALAQDHRNDVFSNTIALFASIGGYYSRPWLDPLGGIIISLYILYTWYNTGLENVEAIIGRSASPELLSKITYVAFKHDERVLFVDTVRAYSVHEKYFVEVDIVLPEDMPLKVTHDIGEALQNKLEKLPEVERAFVHIDYEYGHRAIDEHQSLQ